MENSSGVNIEGNLHFRRKSTTRDRRIPLGISRPMTVKAIFVSPLPIWPRDVSRHPWTALETFHLDRIYATDDFLKDRS